MRTVTRIPYVVAGEAPEAVAKRFDTLVLQASPDDDTFAACAERFSNRQIIELLVVVGQYMMLGRVVATAQIDIDLPTQLDRLVRRPKDGRA